MQQTEALAKLREIPLPEPVSYMPQTVGWLVLALLFLVLLVFLARRAYRQSVRNRYRREALKQLDLLRQSSGDTGLRPESLRKIPELLKQTALVSWPREQVAGLSGAEWLAFLDSTGGSTSLDSETGRDLLKLSYASPEQLADMSEDRISEVVTQVKTWIRRHRAGF